MEARDPHVVQPTYGSPHELRGESGLLGDGYVRGSGRKNRSLPNPFRVSPSHGDRGRLLVPDRFRMHGCDRAIGVYRGLGDENDLAGLGETRSDGRYLGRSLARSEDHFGETAAERPVVVDLGEAEVLERLEWKGPELLRGAVRGHLPLLNRFQDLPEPFGIHGAPTLAGLAQGGGRRVRTRGARSEER